jgi:hypothetical protein
VRARPRWSTGWGRTVGVCDGEHSLVTTGGCLTSVGGRAWLVHLASMPGAPA